MSLSASQIAALVAELQPLVGSRLLGLRLHGERTLSLELMGRGGPALLLLSAEPDVTRLHAAAWRPPAPEAPLPLQALLRRELGGARLAALTARAGDRLVELRWERPPGPEGPQASLRLVAELTGRHGNLFLLDESGLIRAALARSLSTTRRLQPGAAWEPPPARAREEGRGPELLPVAGAAFPLSAATERHYRALEEERRLLEARRRLREPLRGAVARARRALSRLAEEAARVPAAEEDRRLADLLKQNLHALRRGQARAELTEWTGEGPRLVAVALDPALSPQQNMERIYRRYRRIAESAAQVEARAAAVRERLAALEPLLGALDQAGLEELPRLEREARRWAAAPRPAAPLRRRAREPERLPYRAFRALSGALILVGRSAADNDTLTVRVAKGNDVWLHARGHGGSHVVVRLEKGAAGPDQDTLLDAAHLAAWFSDARGAPAVDVAWTRAKHVRKPRGAAPGAVSYSQDRTLLLRVEPARLRRLLAAEEQAAG